MPGTTQEKPFWLQALEIGDVQPFDEMIELAKWSRPIGRWIRVLLVVAGDVERNPGP